MLTLTRKIGESIRIGDDISIIIKEVKGRQVRVGIVAPRDIYVCREELYLKIQESNRDAARNANQAHQQTENILSAAGSLLLSHQAQRNQKKIQQTTQETSNVAFPKLTHVVATPSEVTHKISGSEDQDEG